MLVTVGMRTDEHSSGNREVGIWSKLEYSFRKTIQQFRDFIHCDRSQTKEIWWCIRYRNGMRGEEQVWLRRRLVCNLWILSERKQAYIVKESNIGLIVIALKARLSTVPASEVKKLISNLLCWNLQGCVESLETTDFWAPLAYFFFASGWGAIIIMILI